MPAPKPAASPPDDAQDDAPATINRNYSLLLDDAEWLRETAFMERSTQTALVHEALADLRRKYERKQQRKK